MAVMCAWASVNELGKVNGGKAGDQTGKEVKCGRIYNFGQTRVYRCKNRNKAVRIGAAAKGMATNNNFGYCQNHRTTGYNALKNAGWVVANVKSPVEIDCSELAACAVNVAYGKSMIPSSVYSGNIGKALLNTGLFKELKASKYLGKSEYIECGDIIVAPGKHVIVAYTDGSKTSQNTIKTTVASAIGGNKLIKRGQKEAVKFTGVNIAVDGICGTNTNKMKSRVLQHAINLDYKAGLVEDGIIRQEIDGRTGLSGLAHYGKQTVHQIHHGDTSFITVLIDEATTLDSYSQLCGKGIYHRGTYAVQTTAGLVGGIIEFTAGMKSREYQALRTDSFFVHSHGNTTSVIFHGCGAVGFQCHLYRITISGQMLVHRVINDLVDQMIQSLGGDAADIHSGSFSYRFQTFQNGNT